MGKKILVQRRGRGTKIFQAQRINKVAPAKIIPAPLASKEGSKFVLVDLMHERGRNAPLAKFEFGNTGTTMYLAAVEGISIGEIFEIGENVELKVGNILPLRSLPESTPICIIERNPGDGGKFCKSSGSGAIIVSKTPKHVTVLLKSGKSKDLNPECRAVIGIIAGGGRVDKPILKVGKRFMFKRARGKLGAYPRVSGVAMNHHVHPYGGSQHKSPKMPNTVSRHAPPGRKVGLIAARRTGRKKGKVILTEQDKK